MKITVQKRYMKFPVSPEMQPKRLLLKQNGQVMADLVCTVDPISPQFWYYWDAREQLGQTYELIWEPEIDYIPKFVDKVPTEGIDQERFRPTAHFSTSRGWINDPNGLVFYEGKYHMFYQHNPVAPVWGNMHWGHAVSSDLLHWEEMENALFPDEFGTMFSGSAIIDTGNLTGLQENEHAPLLLYYTAAGNTSETSKNAKFTQCMAYSTDGGVTFRKYQNNPVVPHIVGDNRDPKVIYVPEESCYYMALYLDGNEYGLLTSENLLDWTMNQRINLPGDAECPDFFPLTTESGNRYWILIGASDRYLVGKLQNGQFTPVQDVKSLQIRGKAYAAQSFSGIPDDRKIRFSWNQSVLPGCIANSSMSTPAELTLIEANQELWLCVNPIREYAALTIDNQVTSDSVLTLTGTAQDILLELNVSDDAEIETSVFGLNFRISAVQNALFVKDLTIPLFRENGILKLRLITDVHATEIYVADGRIFTCVDHIADRSLNRISVKTVQGTADVLQLSASTLRNIWN